MKTPQSARRHVRLAWQLYRAFTWQNVHAYAPQKAGVYKLAVPNTSGKLTVFYVGQADDLDARLKDHLSDDEPNDCLRRMVENYTCKFTFATVPLANDRDAAERALFFHFSPSCNDYTPSGPDYIVEPLTT
jgi:excinuclease UvrABC nuclease subunit